MVVKWPLIAALAAAVVLGGSGLWYMNSREQPQEVAREEILTIDDATVEPPSGTGAFILSVTYYAGTSTDRVTCGYRPVSDEAGPPGQAARFTARGGTGERTVDKQFYVTEPGRYVVTCEAEESGESLDSAPFLVTEPERERERERSRGGGDDDLGLVGIFGGSVSQGSTRTSTESERSGTAVRTPFFPRERAPPPQSASEGGLGLVGPGGETADVPRPDTTASDAGGSEGATEGGEGTNSDGGTPTEASP